MFILALAVGVPQEVHGLSQETLFRPSFHKKLVKVKRLQPGGFRQRDLKKGEKKRAYINWQKLYWGKLIDLVYGPDEWAEEGQGPESFDQGNVWGVSDTEDTQGFARELRQELKAFAKDYGLKVVWTKKSRNQDAIPDLTGEFLEYWDKGLSDREGGLPSLRELACAAKEGMGDQQGTNGRQVGPLKIKQGYGWLDNHWAAGLLKKAAFLGSRLKESLQNTSKEEVMP